MVDRWVFWAPMFSTRCGFLVYMPKRYLLEGRLIPEALCLSLDHANLAICNRRYENRAESLS